MYIKNICTHTVILLNKLLAHLYTLYPYASTCFIRSSIYRIMHIVRGGKVSRLHDLVIRGKTFAIVQQFETPYNS